jgi:hypothetical protein
LRIFLASNICPEIVREDAKEPRVTRWCQFCAIFDIVSLFKLTHRAISGSASSSSSSNNQNQRDSASSEEEGENSDNDSEDDSYRTATRSTGGQQLNRDVKKALIVQPGETSISMVLTFIDSCITSQSHFSSRFNFYNQYRQVLEQ